MNKLLLFITLVFIFSTTRAQLYLYIGTSTIIPQAPSKEDSIKICTHTGTPYPSSKVSRSFTINNSQKTIDIELCYYITTFANPVTYDYLDTFSIGQLTPGIYNVTVKNSLSSTPSVCSTYSSNSASVTFTVSDNLTRLNVIDETTVPLNIYPNPVNNKLNVEFDSFEISNFKIELISSLGQVINTLKPLTQKQEVDLSFLSSGIYFLKFQNNSEQKIFKVIKE